MLKRLTARKEWKFFAVLPQADRGIGRRPGGACCCCAGSCRRCLPFPWACAGGGGATWRRDLAGPLAFAGAIFVLLQVLSPIHQALSANLGDRTAAWLYDRLTEACVRPPGIGHLEDPTLASDLTVARDFDLGMTGPPLSVAMDFIASRPGRDGWAAWLPRSFSCATPGGRRSCCWRGRGWPPTGCCARAAVWRDRQNPEVRAAQRDADYAYRLAVDPPASKELRLFGLAGWTIDRFIARRTRLHQLAVRRHPLARAPGDLEPAAGDSRPTCWCSGCWPRTVAHGGISLGEAVVYVQSAVGVAR